MPTKFIAQSDTVCDNCHAEIQTGQWIYADYWDNEVVCQDCYEMLLYPHDDPDTDYRDQEIENLNQ